MKFRAERTEFDEAVQWIQRTLGERVLFPAMAGIKVTVAGDSLVLSSTNGSVDSELTLPVQGGRDGTLLVSGKILSGVVRLLPSAPVEAESEGDVLHLRCGRAAFELRLMAVEDFPQLRQPGAGAPAVTLKAADFAATVAQVAKSASTEDARPVLTGVLLEAADGRFTAAATDSYRLAVRSLPWSDAGEMSALVARRALEQARGAAELLGSEVRLVLEPTQATFEFSDRRLVTTLIEGKFPDFRQLIPTGFDRRLLVNRGELTEVVRRISVVGEADKTMTPVVLAMDAETLQVRAESSEAGQAEEAMQVELEGDPLEIAFNPRFLLDGLDAVGTEQVVCEFRDELKPAVLRPAAGEDDRDDEVDFLYLLMPVRV